MRLTRFCITHLAHKSCHPRERGDPVKLLDKRWIPAFAGMTEGLDSRVRENDKASGFIMPMVLIFMILISLLFAEMLSTEAHYARIHIELAEDAGLHSAEAKVWPIILAHFTENSGEFEIDHYTRLQFSSTLRAPHIWQIPYQIEDLGSHHVLAFEATISCTDAPKPCRIINWHRRLEGL